MEANEDNETTHELQIMKYGPLKNIITGEEHQGGDYLYKLAHELEISPTSLSQVYSGKLGHASYWCRAEEYEIRKQALATRGRKPQNAVTIERLPEYCYRVIDNNHNIQTIYNVPQFAKDNKLIGEDYIALLEMLLGIRAHVKQWKLHKKGK